MDRREILLADITMLRLDGLPRNSEPWSTSRCSKSGGGNTFGLVNTTWRRSVRMPVSASAFSSRFTFSALRRRMVAHQTTAGKHIRNIHFGDSLEETAPLVG